MDGDVIRMNQRGALLISSYLVLAVMGVFSMALYSHEFTAIRSYERAQNLVRAFHLAESGVDLAITQLRQNSFYTGQGYTNLGKGGYEVQVQIPNAGTATSDPAVRLITSTGHTPDNIAASYAYQRRQVVAHVRLTGSPFGSALLAKRSIEITGNAVTDSYDSRTGVVGSNGDIGTNGTAAGAIKLSGNAQVKGDAVAGPGADVPTAIVTTGNSVIEGTRSAASSPVTLNPVQIPSNLVNQGNLNASGNNTISIPGGTYWYSSIQISGNASVRFTGPTVLYVSGQISISGNGIITPQNLPPNLLIYVSSSPPPSSSVSFSGNGNFYGAIYAPDSTVQVSGNAAFYGAVVGDKIHHSGNGRIRYDEALTAVGGGSSNIVSLLAWTET